MGLLNSTTKVGSYLKFPNKEMKGKYADMYSQPKPKFILESEKGYGCPFHLISSTPVSHSVKQHMQNVGWLYNEGVPVLPSIIQPCSSVVTAGHLCFIWLCVFLIFLTSTLQQLFKFIPFVRSLSCKKLAIPSSFSGPSHLYLFFWLLPETHNGRS